MNVDVLKKILRDNKILIDHKESSKNLVAICPFCGDHPNPSKRGHLYISKDKNYPIYHCFINNCVGNIHKLVKSITGSTKIANDVITKKEISNTIKTNLSTSNIKSNNNNNVNKLKLPKIEKDKFLDKIEYIKMRSCNKLDMNFFSNLIFDVKEFLKLNPNINMIHEESDKFKDFLQSNFVGFLSRNQSLLIFRNIDKNDKFKFKKYVLSNNKFDMIDYMHFENNLDSNTVVLSEGIFDIIGEMSNDTLKQFDKTLLYASGQSFSYESLLKSICFDYNLYKVNVIILSDNDKPGYKYKKFIRNTKHIVNKLKIYYNKDKKDFGMFPIQPIQLKI